MAAINSNQSEIPQKAIIYWDYENCPIPSGASSFGNVHDVIQNKIFDYLQHEVQVETRIYIAAHKLSNKMKDEMDISSAKVIDIPSLKPEAVDKRILADLALDLYEWKGRDRHVVVLISGDKDFGNMLGRIRGCREVAKLILMRLPCDYGFELPINKNLYSCVDYIFDGNHGSGFAVQEFMDCKHGIKCTRNRGECKYYHHKTHYINKENANLQNPYFNDDSEPEIDPSLLKERSRVPCKYRDKCKNWKKNKCHFNHSTVWKGSYHKPCRWGEKCKYFPLGLCEYTHASSSYQEQIQQQQKLAKQQSQELDAMLNHKNNTQIKKSNIHQNKWSYNQLKSMNATNKLPANVDPAKLELYLPDADFEFYFGRKFYSLSEEKQAEMKKDLGLS